MTHITNKTKTTDSPTPKMRGRATAISTKTTIDTQSTLISTVRKPSTETPRTRTATVPNMCPSSIAKVMLNFLRATNSRNLPNFIQGLGLDPRTDRQEARVTSPIGKSAITSGMEGQATIITGRKSTQARTNVATNMITRDLGRSKASLVPATQNTWMTSPMETKRARTSGITKAEAILSQVLTRTSKMTKVLPVETQPRVKIFKGTNTPKLPVQCIQTPNLKVWTLLRRKVTRKTLW